MNILLTGAGSGLGKATTEYLSRFGNCIFACDLKPPVKENNIIPMAVDITQENQLKAVFTELQKGHVKLDAMINVAGIFHMDNLLEIQEERLVKMLEVNLLGAIRVNKIFFPLLREHGKILITSSEVAPLDPVPFNSVYHITKTALDSYAQALRQEAGLLGYHVITVRPGAFATPLEQSSVPSMREMSESSRYFGGQAERFAELMRMFTGKPADPVKYAKLIEKILRKKHPAAVYTIHANIGLRLLALLPKNMQVSVVKRLLK